MSKAFNEVNTKNIELCSIEELKEIAVSYHSAGELEKALFFYEKILSVDDNDVLSLNNSAAIYVGKNLWVKAKKIFEKIITIDGNNTAAYCNLGTYHKNIASHKHTLSFKMAEFFFKKSIKVGDNYKAALNLAMLYFEARDYKQTIQSAEMAWKLVSNDDKLSKVEILYHIISAKYRVSDYDKMELYENHLKSELKENVSVNLEPMICSFNIQMSPYTNQFYNEYVGRLYKNKSCTYEIGARKNILHCSEKIKLGYISSDLKNHSVSLLIKDIIKNHNKDMFEVYVYYIGAFMDHVVEDIRDNVDFLYHICMKTNPRELRKQLIHDNLDVLIDLNGHTGVTALPILREQIVPIQCHMLGFYGPICMKSINYFIANEHLIPFKHRSFFREKIIYLPDIVQAAPKFHGKDYPYNKKEDFGLPENKFVFASFSSSYRIDVQTVSIWSKILKKCTDSVLWLNVYTDEAANNIRKYFKSKGVNEDRLFFLKEVLITELNAMKLVDVYLDTARISAGTSSFISLSSGVPVITLPNSRPESRTTTAILHGCDLSELVSASPADYINKCYSLYRNPTKLIKLKQKILNNRDVCHTFNQSRFTYNLEQGIIEAYNYHKETGGYKDMHVKPPEETIFSTALQKA